MSVEVNLPALELLLKDPEGPVGLDLKRRVDRVTDAANRNIEFILARVPPSVRPVAVGEVRVDNGELEGIVGLLNDDQDLTKYLAGKEQTERRWLEPALKAALEDGA